MTTLEGLHLIEWDGGHGVTPRDRASASASAPAPAPVVVLVHGSLDRAQSFRRVARRLAGYHVVAYDRRGYAGSRPAGAERPLDLDQHATDLLALVDGLVGPDDPRLTLVGHSFGGDVVIAAALRAPGRIASVGAFEPPMPWLGFRRTAGPQGAPPTWPTVAEDPGDEAERFYRRMVGDGSWEHLSEAGRAARRADGPALVADLQSFRGPAPFDVTRLAVPAVFGRGGPRAALHHRLATAWLAAHVPGAALFEIGGAGHGAHLSHPDGFADFVHAAVAAGRGVDDPPPPPADRSTTPRP